MMFQWRGEEVAEERVLCPVLDDGVSPPEAEVNAFRIVPETGDTYFLDFIHYSAASQQAMVVGRVRVHEDTMASIKDRLSNDMLEIPHNDGLSISWCAEKPGLVN